MKKYVWAINYIYICVFYKSQWKLIKRVNWIAIAILSIMSGLNNVN